MLVWAKHWWQVVDFVELKHQNAEGAVVHTQQGIVIIPTGPTTGAEKRYLAGQKKATREDRVKRGNVLPFETAASQRKAHNDRVLARAEMEDQDA